MPGFLTHYIGGESALRALDPQISGYVAPNAKLFNLGTQGPDIFFYYIPGFITKRIRGVGTQMHDSGLGQYFMYMADLIKDSQSPAQRQIIFAYTAGFLAHYAIDVHTHGYVYASTQADTGMKESSLHRHFETSIDVLMLDRTHGQKPRDYKQWQLISPDKETLRVAAAAMHGAIQAVYGLNIRHSDTRCAMSHMSKLTRCLQSRSGRRKRWLGRAEDIIVGSRIISALVHMEEVTDGRDYLNLAKAPWHAPWTPDITREESFVELFEAAISEAASMITALHDCMHNNLPREELSKIIMNRSLKTGEHTS